jgi:hypothetical protein
MSSISENTPGNTSLKLMLCFFVTDIETRSASALQTGQGMTEAQNWKFSASVIHL